jgi:hypothetical protein
MSQYITIKQFRSKLAQIRGFQDWFSKRLANVMAFTLLDFERVKSGAEGDSEFFETLAIMNYELMLLVDHHLRFIAGLKRLDLPRRAEEVQTSKILRMMAEVLGNAYEELLPQFGPTGLLDAADPLALTKAIFYNLDGITVEEANQDALALRKLYQEAGEEAA